MKKIILYLNIFSLFLIIFISLALFSSYFFRDFIDKPINYILEPMNYSYKTTKLNKFVSNIDENNYSEIYKLFNSYKKSSFDNNKHEYAKILFFGLSDYWFENNDFDSIIKNSKSLLKINPYENRVRYQYFKALIASDNNENFSIDDIKIILDEHPYDLGFIELYFKNASFMNYDECISHLEPYLLNVMMTESWSYHLLDYNGNIIRKGLISPDEFREVILEVNSNELVSSIFKVNIPPNLFISVKISYDNNHTKKNKDLTISTDKNSNSTIMSNGEIISHGAQTQYFNITNNTKNMNNENIKIRLNFDFSFNSKQFNNNLCTKQ
jgi:hypothetical protein